MAKNLIQHPTISRAELLVSDLAFSVYQGESENLQKHLKQGIDWSSETDLLTAALWGGHKNLIEDLIAAGHPISESTYKEFYYYGNHDFLDLLPPRADLIDALELENLWHDFQHALIKRDEDKASTLLPKVLTRINEKTTKLGDRVARAPLHYAAERALSEIIAQLVEAGADVNLLDGKGRSALRLVAECSHYKRSERKHAFSILEEKGAKAVPPFANFFENWKASQGFKIS